MTDSTASPPTANRGRRTLLLLAVVFLGPMAVAMALYFTGFELRPGGTTQHGELFLPPRPMPDVGMTLLGDPAGTAQLYGKWTLIYAGPGQCDDSCQQTLVEIRQVRRALGRDMDRVQRLYLVTSGTAARDFLGAEHPGLGIVEAPIEVQELVGIIGDIHAGDLFLSDPLGNLVMRYPAGTTMKAIHTGLQRLLKISTIG